MSGRAHVEQGNRWLARYADPSPEGFGYAAGGTIASRKAPTTTG